MLLKGFAQLYLYNCQILQKSSSAFLLADDAFTTAIYFGDCQRNPRENPLNHLCFSCLLSLQVITGLTHSRIHFIATYGNSNATNDKVCEGKQQDLPCLQFLPFPVALRAQSSPPLCAFHRLSRENSSAGTKPCCFGNLLKDGLSFCTPAIIFCC